MKLLLVFASFSFVLFVSCGFLDIAKGEKLSVEIMSSLKKGDWDYIRDNSSKSYRKKNPENKFNDLKKWVNSEFGKIKSYKKILLYTGSDFRIHGENYVTATYLIQGNKGNGEIEIVIIREEGKYKLFRMDFSKKQPQ
jgi:hypothetical protein